MLAQVARRTKEPNRKKTPEASPAELDLAEYHEEWDEDDFEHPTTETQL